MAWESEGQSLHYSDISQYECTVPLRQGDPLGEGFFPHLVGGFYHPKSFLFFPYPALPPNDVRRPHIRGARTAPAHYKRHLRKYNGDEEAAVAQAEAIEAGRRGSF